MLRILSVFLPIAAAASMKAIPYGDIKSAETLFQSSTPVSTNTFRLPDIHHSILPEPTAMSNVSLLVQSETFGEPDKGLGLDAENIFVGKEMYEDEHDSYLRDVHDQASAAAEESHSLHERQQRTIPMDAGVMQIDCLQAPDICKNAGYYQNCIRRAYGNINLVTYSNGPYSERYAKGNRKQSGATLSSGSSTPCNGWPFAQKFWHPQTGGSSQPALQTDEWPMASFTNNPFNPAAPPISLRCMTSTQNSAGSTAWTNFRNCEGEYDPRPGSSGFSKWRGKYAYGTRNLPCRPLIVNDWFRVNFNFSSFDPNNQAHNNLRRQLVHADRPSPQTCAVNDGLQWHLTRLSGSGRFGQPYDRAIHNTYKVSGQTRDIEQYHVTIIAYGRNLDTAEVEIRTRFDANWNILARRTANLPIGGSLVVPSSATLPLPFRIDRTNSCRYVFNYGNPQTDGVRWFGFNSQNTGWEKAPDKSSTRPANQYCGTTNIPRGDRRGVGKVTLCTFPAW